MEISNEAQLVRRAYLFRLAAYVVARVMGGANNPDFEPLLLRSSSSRSNGRVGFEMHVKQGVFLQCAMVFFFL
jgi:hypothetical protein